MTKRMKKYCILIICLFSLGHLWAQQDAQYSLYQFNQMSINPAYAGARDAIAVIMDVRKQWAGFGDGAPTTLGFTVHSPILNNKVGVGLNVISDKIGARSVTGAYGNFAYIAKLNNRIKLSFGLRAGYLNYQFNYSKVNYQYAESGTVDLSNANKGALDMDAGVFLKSNTFFAGISATHLTQANIYTIPVGQLANSSSYVLASHLFIVVGKAFAVNENVVFNPTVMIKSVRSQTTADLNFNVLLKKRIWLGTFLRGGYGIGALIQVYATDKFRIGYSYDTGLGIKKQLGSSHEFMLGFDFGNYQSKMVSPRLL